MARRLREIFLISNLCALDFHKTPVVSCVNVKLNLLMKVCFGGVVKRFYCFKSPYTLMKAFNFSPFKHMLGHASIY